MDRAKKRVLETLNEKREGLIGLAKELIRFKSITFHPSLYSKTGEEKQCQQFIAERLEALGFTVEMWDPDTGELGKYKSSAYYMPNRNYKNRPDLAAFRKGSGGGRSILLTGHIDVVPAEVEEGWTTDPWNPVVKDGRLIGRGSVDMKGGVAALMTAIEAITKAGVKLKGDLLFGTTVDEEAGGMGALSLCAKGYKADAGILTEATNMQIHLLCRGIVHGKIMVKGKSGHIEIGQPHWKLGGAVDAFKKALHVVRGIDDLNEDWSKKPEKNHRFLGYPCRVDITMVQAGQQPSSYPSECTLVFDAQYLPGELDENGMGSRVRAEIEGHLKRIVESDEWLSQNRPKIEWMDDADCVEIPASHPLVEIMVKNMKENECPPSFGGCGFHSENSTFSNIGGTPTILFGPGDPAKAHQSNEYVDVEEVVKATKVIALSIMDWCGYEQT
jgi:acetylornithine deacetylase